MAKMQRLRGRAYGADGAIQASELTADGLHKLSIDERSWHVLSLDSDGEVIACLRYLEESDASGFESLRIRSAALARCPVQGPRFRRAVEREMDRANRSSIGLAKWAAGPLPKIIGGPPNPCASCWQPTVYWNSSAVVPVLPRQRFVIVPQPSCNASVSLLSSWMAAKFPPITIRNTTV